MLPMDGLYPAITVIIPVYKVERWLPRCLDSLLAQYDAWYRNFRLPFEEKLRKAQKKSGKL